MVSKMNIVDILFEIIFFCISGLILIFLMLLSIKISEIIPVNLLVDPFGINPNWMIVLILLL